MTVHLVTTYGANLNYLMSPDEAAELEQKLTEHAMIELPLKVDTARGYSHHDHRTEHRTLVRTATIAAVTFSSSSNVPKQGR